MFLSSNKNAFIYLFVLSNKLSEMPSPYNLLINDLSQNGIGEDELQKIPKKWEKVLSFLLL